jgi:hypothetical protein
VSDSAVSQVRAQAITMANENIDRTIETAEAILAQFEIIRRVRDCSRPPASVRECSKPLASWPLGRCFEFDCCIGWL